MQEKGKILIERYMGEEKKYSSDVKKTEEKTQR
jgi:hypothetical protein|uniref:Uncharacterized protein n=1 Tax=Populus trichocarpa TaxID=3694 RepID=A0A3N7EH61_POPTR